MLAGVEDLFEIDQKIAGIEEERKKLAKQLERARVFEERALEVAKRNNELVDEIVHKATSLANVQSLREKYGDLKVLRQLESFYLEQEAQEKAQERLKALDQELDSTNEVSLEKLKYWYDELVDIDSSGPVYTRFEEICQQEAHILSEEFKKTLLETKWDTQTFVPVAIDTMRQASTDLYHLGQFIFGGKPRLWNFECIANNFKIRFTYHFHKDTFKLETYFNFLNDYLQENLHKAISIFHDEGLSKQFVLEQFIDHVLAPIRDKVRANLMRDDRSIIITLISQILNTDRNLSHKFHYHGDGLISLISPEIWDLWLSHQAGIATRQYQQITANPKEMAQSASDFLKLLNRAFETLTPFYEIEAPSLRRYKLLSCSQIFIGLTSTYMDYLVSVDALDKQHTDEEELYQTLVKLQNFSTVYKRIFELSQEYIMISLTDIVNEKEGKNYQSLFQSVLTEYRKIIDDVTQPTMVHRIQKLLKESLRNYFKIGSWSSQNQQSSNTSAEVVNAIKLMSRIILGLDSLDIPLEVSLAIKNDLLNIIVNYFIESILKLNRFNRIGLNQFRLDFHALKESLNLPDTAVSSQEIVITELLAILDLKYDTNHSEFFETSYIKRAEYNELRTLLSIKKLKDSEIQDALYRVAYGNVI
ncbi:Tip20p TDEL_0G02590 [Torulaspora delbrueckii]|uniref:Uncharacterized protein n=1 Tax=Torulaspora delbrueckii TaxID=4950 RepID=G8ZZ01_TORDE|nr:hypothetical protein TDEL_0G02590 [Torulaspora delbrueckii]CCE93626.1 hypothetical protein TDEL_0G02590 [Torulaspora delbrueckii]